MTKVLRIVLKVLWYQVQSAWNCIKLILQVLPIPKWHAYTYHLISVEIIKVHAGQILPCVQVTGNKELTIGSLRVTKSQRVINLVVLWVLKYNFIRHSSTFAAACNNKMWVCIAVISSNILVVKVTGVYFACVIWPQRQGSIGKQEIYRAEQGIYEKSEKYILIANHISVFILSIV